MRRSTIAAVALIAAILTACGQPTAVEPAHSPAPATRAALPSHQTVTYCTPGGTPLAMDIWAPAPAPAHAPPPAPGPAPAPAPAPVALHVHGGGWSSGSRRGGGYLTDLEPQLTQRGFLVASIDYRLAPNPWPDEIDDVRCAVTYLRSHATALNIDPHRIGVWGESAGGHLVSLLGTDPGDAGPVQAVADLFGPADLNATGGGWSPPVEQLLNRVFGPSPQVRADASPVNHVAPGDPPFLILQGDRDTTVPPAQSQELAQRLSAAGVPVRLVMVRGGGHGLSGPGMDPTQSQLEADVVDFLTSRLQS